MAVRATLTETERLVRKLNNQELIIQRLFNMASFDLFSSQPNDVILLKLKLMEDLIEEIPDLEEEVANQWRDKVARLWKRYDDRSGFGFRVPRRTPPGLPDSLFGTGASRQLIITSTGSSFQPPWESLPSSSKSYSPPSSTSSFMPIFRDNRRLVSSETPSSSSVSSLALYPPRSVAPVVHSNHIEDTAESRVQKEALHMQLKQEFDQIQIVDDRNDMIRLLAQVVRARKLSNPYADNSLRNRLFKYAFEKLPELKKHIFLANFGLKRCWNNLPIFLRMQIQYPDSLMPVIGGGSVESGDDYCVHCSMAGHSLTNCWSIRRMLCFDCFEYGHTNRTCPNPPLVQLN